MFKNNSIIMNDGKTTLSHLLCYDLKQIYDTQKQKIHVEFFNIACLLQLNACVYLIVYFTQMFCNYKFKMELVLKNGTQLT